MTKPPGVETISAVEPDVIVAGAGIAGLAAARTLAEAGLRVLLIEASERVGGRLRTEHVPGLNDAIELGAEFVHGRPPRLLALIEEAGLHLEELEGRAYCPSDQRGKLSHCPENRAFHVLEQLERDPIAVSEPDRDESFAAWLQRQNVDAATRESATGYVEGFNAADATLMSIQALARQQSAETEIENDRAFHIVEGYTALADYVHRRYQAAGGKTLLETCVEAVSRHNGRVNLEVRSKSFGADTERTGKDLSYVLTAKKVVVALPLGVLLSGRVRFEPAANVLAALDSLAMGPVHRRTLVFRERFWASFDHPYGDMHFLFSPGQVPPVWWTRSPSTSAVLTAWMGGASSFQVQHEVFAARVLQTLGETFQIGKDELRGMLISSHAHDWNSDPFCLGAYSYVRKGGLSRSRSLSKPEAGTLFFAGEHTDTSGHWGTVHGALASGLRAAAQVLAES